MQPNGVGRAPILQESTDLFIISKGKTSWAAKSENGAG